MLNGYCKCCLKGLGHVLLHCKCFYYLASVFASYLNINLVYTGLSTHTGEL